MRKDLTELPEWHAVCQRYRYNITRFAIEALGMTPTLQQRALFASVALGGWVPVWLLVTGRAKLARQA